MDRRLRRHVWQDLHTAIRSLVSDCTDASGGKRAKQRLAIEDLMRRKGQCRTGITRLLSETAGNKSMFRTREIVQHAGWPIAQRSRGPQNFNKNLKRMFLNPTHAKEVTGRNAPSGASAGDSNDEHKPQRSCCIKTQSTCGEMGRGGTWVPCGGRTSNACRRLMLAGVPICRPVAERGCGGRRAIRHTAANKQDRLVRGNRCRSFVRCLDLQRPTATKTLKDNCSLKGCESKYLCLGVTKPLLRGPCTPQPLVC